VGVGELIRRGERIVEIASCRFDVELPSPVAELLADDGDTVNGGHVIARILAAADGPGGGTAGAREPRRPLPSDDTQVASSDA
jgi:pyruvate/2-oxoglutarate dehydrogenase complex dihydrolipoamide acyltransferase (E2) component